MGCQIIIVTEFLLCYIKLLGAHQFDIEVFEMKSFLCLLTVAGIFLFLAPFAIGAPIVSVDKPVFDFGVIAQGKRVDHVFILKNKGDSVLNLGNVSTSCGCTVADVSSRSVAPGKISDIRVSFNSANFSGNINKSVTIQTNDPKTPVYTLVLKGSVFEEINVAPKQLNLGEIKIGFRKVVSLTVENSGKEPVTLTSLKSTMPQVSLKANRTTIRAGGKAVISISVTPRNSDRFLGGYLTINTSSPEKPEIVVPVYATASK